ncbi:HERC3 ligase, partial [Irena cyanogastra]|nr:HERC3 ligase [Irena cyanogastra]
LNFSCGCSPGGRSLTCPTCLAFLVPLAVFLTGSDRIPIYGMSSLRIIIQSTPNGEQYLPVAHTCYNLLDLPKYSSKEILSARLVQAIDHYEGFSLA